MVNSTRHLLEFIGYCATPAVASAIVIGTAWIVSPGRRTGWWWAPPVLVALISGGLGLLAYLEHAPDVSSSRALGGAALAAITSAVPLSGYYAVGRFVRGLPQLVISWIASLALLYPYAFIALVYVVAQTQCGPDAVDCPFG